MRVTNNMMILNLLGNTNKNLQSMSKYQDQLATGKTISSPMDDPVGIAKVLKYKTDLSDLDQFEANTRDALAWLQNTESAMIDINSAYQRMRELAVQAANGTNSEDDTTKIADEIEQLKDHVMNLGNATFAGRYIFSGSQTDQKLMNEDGTYNINVTTNDIEDTFYTEYQLGVGENIKVSTSGIDLFGYVDIDNFASDYFPDNKSEGESATPAQINGSFDLEADHTANDYDITYTTTTPAATVTYNVDESQLNGSQAYPLTKEEVLDAFKAADDGSGNLLGEVADVYYDLNGKLVISTKNVGSNYTLEESGNDLLSGPNTGDDSVNASVVGVAIATDSDVADAKGVQSMEISLNGITKTVEIDMNTASDLTGLEFEMQTAIDDAFSDVSGYTAGDIVVSAATGTITISTDIDPDSTDKQVLEVRPIQSAKSLVADDIDKFIDALKSGDKDGISDFISNVDTHLNTLLTQRSNIGARVNRMELVLNRIAENSVNFTRLLSDTEDADMSEVIMYLKNAENVYRASLQTGARVIQPSLIDFIS